MLLVGAALISTFFLISLYTQQVLDTPSVGAHKKRQIFGGSPSVRAQKKEPNLWRYSVGKGSEKRAKSLALFLSPLSDSNRRPPLYKSGALAN